METLSETYHLANARPVKQNESNGDLYLTVNEDFENILIFEPEIKNFSDLYVTS